MLRAKDVQELVWELDNTFKDVLGSIISVVSISDSDQKNVCKECFDT